jgi:ATP-dependent Lon protease
MKPQEEDIYRIGTIAEIKQLLKLPGGTIRVLVEGLSRAEIVRYIAHDPYMKVEIKDYPENPVKTPEIEALMRSLVYQFEQYVKMSKKIPPETVVSIVSLEVPGRLADIIASHLTLRINDKQMNPGGVDVGAGWKDCARFWPRKWRSWNWNGKSTSGSASRWRKPRKSTTCGSR